MSISQHPTLSPDFPQHSIEHLSEKVSKIQEEEEEEKAYHAYNPRFCPNHW